jgi:diketogulonate reductase-like aldo/keto reductase
MNYRILGKTGIPVSEVGYGAWGIGKSGWIGASDDESIKALHRSIDLGLNFIGMRSVGNVERNCQVGDGRGLPREQLEKLTAHRWLRNFYG